LSPEQVERRRRQMRAVNARRAGLDLHRGSDETSALVGFRPDPAPPVKGLQPASWPDPRDGQSGPALSPVA
jgi:hypothetical protein